MIRRVASLALLGLAISGAADAQRPHDWRTSVVKTPAGGYRIGNPQAKAKLIEYVSYTCPHCGAFVKESAAPLRDGLVREGKVQVEVRSMVRDGLDMASAMLVRCGGPARFPRAHELVFANQAALLERMRVFQSQPNPYAGADTDDAKLKRIAERSGLVALMQRGGLAPAAAAKCLADAGLRQELETMNQSMVGRITGTPSFELNGNLLAAHGWADVEVPLRAALAQ